jgi:sortase A
VDVPGSAIGILEIPRMHLDMVVVQGVDTASLEKGPGHYPGSALPWENRGRVAIAAHRTTYLHPFWSLNLLRSGDLIKIETEYGTFRYHVTRSATLSPADRSVLDQTANPTLVLTTCTPRFSASHRLVVFADRE